MFTLYIIYPADDATPYRTLIAIGWNYKTLAGAKSGMRAAMRAANLPAERYLIEDESAA